MEASIYSFFTFAASLSVAWEGKQTFWVDSRLNREYKEKIGIFSFVKKSPKSRGIKSFSSKNRVFRIKSGFFADFFHTA